MTGPLALVGGSEHTAACETTDRALLAHVPAPRPVVAVLPFASSVRTRARTVGRALEWWGTLGAVPVVVPPEPGEPSRLLDHADLIVLTGGVPDRLHDRLLGTPLWAQVVARWRDGAVLSGSSSGAMLLGAARQSVRAPFAVVPAAGLLPSVAVAPHHQQRAPRSVAAWRARTHPHLTILGLDDATALVARPVPGTARTSAGPGPVLAGAARWQVHGPGQVTIRRGLFARTYHTGDEVAPEVLGLWTPTDRTTASDGAVTPTRERHPQPA